MSAGIGRATFGTLGRPPESASAASLSRTSASVEWPVLVFFWLGKPRREKSSSESCLGESGLTRSSPSARGAAASAAPRICSRSSSARRASFSRCSSRRSGVDQDAGPLHLEEDRDQRHLDVPGQVQHAVLLAALLQQVAQAERDVGVLGGVGGDAVERRLGDALLRRVGFLAGLLADEFGDGDAAVVQLRERERVHAQPGGVAQEGGDHGVEDRALHLGSRVMERVQVVLEVLAELGDRPVGQQRLQHLDDLFEAEVRLRLGRDDGHVHRFALLPAHRDADQAGLVTHAQRLGVDGDPTRGPRGFHGFVQGGPRGDAGVAALPRRGEGGVHRVSVLGRSVLLVGGEQPAGGRLLLRSRGLLPERGFGVVGRAPEPRQLARVAVEAAALEERVEAVVVDRVDRDLGVAGVEAGVDVAHQRDELLGKRELTVLDGVLQPLLLLALERRHAGDQAIQVAELLQELRGRLGPDALHAGHVVAGVADERLVVDGLVGADALGGEQARLVAHLLRLDVVEDDPVRDHLLEVLVLADERDAQGGVLAGELLGEGGHDVVGLGARDGEHGQAEAAGDLDHHGDLRLEVLRGGGPVALVIRVEVVAEGGLVGVDHQRRPRGPAGVEELEQHRREREDGPGGLAGDRAGHAAADGVVGPEELVVAVDEVDGFGGVRGVVGHRGEGRSGRSGLYARPCEAALLIPDAASR